MQNNTKASRGRRLAAAFDTMAGVGWFTDTCKLRLEKKAARMSGLLLVYGSGFHLNPYYLAAVLPKRLRNFSTRPPMLSTDFWVPV